MFDHVLILDEWPKFANTSLNADLPGWHVMTPKPEFVEWANQMGIGRYLIEISPYSMSWHAANDNFSPDGSYDPYHRARVSFEHARDLIFFKCALEDWLHDS